MTLVDLLIWVAVLVVVVVVLWFLFNQVSLPEPIRQIVLIVGVVAVAVIAILFLLSLRGGHFAISAEPSQLRVGDLFLPGDKR